MARTSNKRIANDQPQPVAKDPVAALRRRNGTVLLDLLHRPEGATIAQIMAATGWLPHSARAALSGLRKKGHVVVKDAGDAGTTYRIVEPV